MPKLRLFSLMVLFILVGVILSGEHVFAREADSADVSFRLVSDPATMDWTLANSTLETYIIMNIMEGLVEEGPDVKPRPALARSWEISPDGKTYTFHLREDVKWSDGRPLLATDFVDSWVRLLEPSTDSANANLLFDVENAEAYHTGKLKDRAQLGIKAPNASTFQVKLNKPIPYFLHLPTFWVTFPIRLDLIRKFGKSWAMPGKMATLGPYTIEEWKKGSVIRFKKNPKYYSPQALTTAPNTIHALIEGDDQLARKQFAEGHTDFLLNATTEDLLKARSNTLAAGFRVEQYPYLVTYYLAFNVGAGPLKDVNVRRALALAIDRDALPSLLQGGQEVAHSWFPPGIPRPETDNSLKGSLFDAKAALARAGFVEGNHFPKLRLCATKFDGASKVARYIAESFKEKLGVNLEIRFGTSADYLKDPDGALFLSRWGADYPDAENFLSVFSRARARNYARWNNAEYDRYIEKSRNTQDVGERLVAYGAAEKILLQDDVVMLPLFHSKNTVILSEKIKDFGISPLNYLFFKTIAVRTSQK